MGKRVFADRTPRSATRIVSRSSGEVIGYVKPHKFLGGYTSNATRMVDAAPRRKRRNRK